jgi:hypothetical protein
MAVTEAEFKRIIAEMIGVPLTAEQAATLKKCIDKNTDTRSECPCSKCRLAASNQN